MTPERWAQIERLYYAALPRAAGDRAAFLEDACGTDPELRREVESLLKYEPRAAAFLESADRRPAWLRLLRPKPEPPPAAARLVGRAFDGYEVQGLIATGGMSEVYRALDTRLRRLVAIKVLPDHLSDDAERRERFHREARLVSSLNHPHVCALHHVGTHDGFDYLVMEHLERRNVATSPEPGPMKWTEALAYLIQIADALESAHRQGIVHRDLKPANVMITKSGAKVLDFGLGARRARSDGPAEDPGLRGSKGLTVEGRIMGTVPYMSPEQLQGKSTDQRSDIFAFGAVAYEMLAAEAAFDADSPAGVIGAILKDTPESTLTKVPEVPPLLARAIMRCLSKEPRDRWQTTTDLLYELRSVEDLSAGESSHPIAHRASRRGISALWIGTALALNTVLWMCPRTGNAPSANAPLAFGDIRFTLHPPSGTTFPSSHDVPFALSPDGGTSRSSRPLPTASGPLFASSWSGDVLIGVTSAKGSVKDDNDLWIQRVGSPHRERVPFTSDFSETEGSLSRDSRWLAYTSDQTGRNEVWVASSPSGAVRRQVSVAGGRSPQWCGAQDGIVYLGADRRLVIVPLRSKSGDIQLGNPQPLFSLDGFSDFDRPLVPTANSYAAAADCQRFLVAARAADAPAAPISIVVNWPVLLNR